MNVDNTGAGVLTVLYLLAIPVVGQKVQIALQGSGDARQTLKEVVMLAGSTSGQSGCVDWPSAVAVVVSGRQG